MGFLLFEYGTFLPGEAEHDVIAGARHVRAARTAPGYSLVELNAFAAMIEDGQGQVVGELYELEYATLDACDRRREHPRRYQRRTIRLDDGSAAEAYLIGADQARGLRRLRDGDWRMRFKKRRPDAGPFVSWAKSRYRR